jgi:hypothetical protein
VLAIVLGTVASSSAFPSMDKHLVETAYRNALIAELVCEDEIGADDVADLVQLSSSNRHTMDVVRQRMEAGNIAVEEKFELQLCYRQLEDTEALIKSALRRVVI